MYIPLFKTHAFASALRISLQMSILLVIFELGAIPSSKLIILKLVTIALFFSLLVAAWVLEFVAIDKASWIIFSSFVLLMLLSLNVSMLRDLPDLSVSIRAFISYIGVILCAVGLYTSYSLRLISYRKLYLCFIIAVSCWVFVKLLIMFSPLLFDVSPSAVRSYLAGSISIEYRSDSAMFFRISTGNDLLMTFAIFLLLFNKGYGVAFNKYLRLALIFLLSVGVMLSFTRYLWLSGLFIAIFYAYMNRVLLKNSIIITFLFLLFASVSIFMGLGVVDEMFTRMGDVTSISTKSEQATIILKEVNSYPFFGKGVGAYVDGYVRSRYLPFQYETQLLALWMQFGTLGVAILLGIAVTPIASTIKDLFTYKIDKITVGLTLLYLLFLSSSITNPNLFILNVALIYFMVAASVSRRKELSISIDK